MTPPVAAAIVTRRPDQTKMARLLLNHGILPIALVVTYAILSLIQPKFFSAENAINILRQTSYLAIVTTGQMFALLTRGFDLSVGSLISLVGVTSALAMVHVAGGDSHAGFIPVLVGCATGISIGLVIGAINGIAISVFRINPFVTTLGTQGICFGLATTLSNGVPVFNLPLVFTASFNAASWLGVPPPVAASFIVLAAAYFLLNHTVLGRFIYIIGSNVRAAFVAGIASRLHLTAAYVICSVIASIDALFLTARTGSGEPNLGGGLMISSIAAAVIGGVSLRGGEGTVLQVVYGSLFITVLTIGMNLVGVNGYVQQIVIGVVVIGAVLLDRLRTRVRTW